MENDSIKTSGGKAAEPERLSSRPSRRPIIGICGIGQMGSSAAIAFQRAGYRVLLWGRNPTKLRAAETELARLAAWSDQHLDAPKRAGGETLLEPDLSRLDATAD